MKEAHFKLHATGKQPAQAGPTRSTEEPCAERLWLVSVGTTVPDDPNCAVRPDGTPNVRCSLHCGSIAQKAGKNGKVLYRGYPDRQTAATTFGHPFEKSTKISPSLLMPASVVS